ncbi:OVARIAN TUMOR DOMAIN-containing deubiquitinating enzyme 10 [Sesamum angolense]|uniref:OVARIAN TUMOR DOMAIN-containing deubiquitinating enzyme 10 n=1 Tax=Sesamum angolense TaxID=2727404 RepID=A0AAE1WMX0_9LAMI|nr:OVARIAN TUMOR DOMAIN-containing deubiquitinating enzyme 10 [Sesamum angolense]
MHEPESDAAPWSFFNFDNIFSNNYYGDSTQHDVKICHEQYIRDNHFDTECGNIDTDEIIAHALLQEELSQLSIAESPEISHSGEEYSQNSTVVPNWHNSSNNYYLGQDGHLHETDDVGSVCSSPGDRSCDGDDYSYTLDITDESDLDGEVEKRLYQMVPVPLKAHPEMYEGYVPMEYAEYLKTMSKNGEWGDHVTLQAAADSYGVRILVVTSFKDTCYIEILPKTRSPKESYT